MNTSNQTTAAAGKTMTQSVKQGMFVLPDGRNVLFTFCLVSSLFLLWGFCNGMIDVMDKHFQEELHLSLSQSAWVQFAHWMGYFLMSIPAGWLATRLGYKGGIIAGLLLVSVGGFWFIPASKIAAFWAFLLGVCVVASGLTFLETVANPYTTVLGPSRYAAARINTAQSCNGVGWIFGPIAGSMFFYGTDAAGRSTGSQTLWIPYAGVAVGVLILAVIFFFAPVPDVKAEDDYHLDDKGPGTAPAPATREVNRKLSYALLLGNVAALIGVFIFIFWLTFDGLQLGPRLVGLASAIPRPSSVVVSAQNSVLIVLTVAAGLVLLAAAIWLIGVTKRLSHHSVWAHEHFSGATLAQFLYVAAQCGIFSFLINYLTSEPPSLPSSWFKESTSKWIEVRTAFAGSDFKDVSSLATKLTVKADSMSVFLATQLSDATVQTLARYKEGAASTTAARVAMMQDLNSLILKTNIYAPERFQGIALQDKTRHLLGPDAPPRSLPRLNRLLLADAYPQELAFQDGIFGVSNQFAATLASVGFFCFLLGRVTGAAMLRKISAHKMLGLYSVINAVLCFLIYLKLGWLSVVCVFLCYFFMSITFPTIFALGIFGLGARAKAASAYIVMGIVGGALLPKLMGAVADHYNMSRGFIVPLICFVFIAFYGYGWPKLSRVEALHGVGTSGGR
ncbi:MAG TPA: MFS transporter [Candidatus Paceibacterota bacterium]|nr:MFS transporter [Verrucomicrobiota bacterium]HSA10255.1 MFS transporter [Candidatus Paceibacterota bacterium]